MQFQSEIDWAGSPWLLRVCVCDSCVDMTGTVGGCVSTWPLHVASLGFLTDWWSCAVRLQRQHSKKRRPKQQDFL